jgi:hypothetical protein
MLGRSLCHRALPGAATRTCPSRARRWAPQVEAKVPGPPRLRDAIDITTGIEIVSSWQHGGHGGGPANRTSHRHVTEPLRWQD